MEGYCGAVLVRVPRRQRSWISNPDDDSRSQAQLAPWVSTTQAVCEPSTVNSRFARSSSSALLSLQLVTIPNTKPVLGKASRPRLHSLTFTSCSVLLPNRQVAICSPTCTCHLLTAPRGWSQAKQCGCHSLRSNSPIAKKLTSRAG